MKAMRHNTTILSIAALTVFFSCNKMEEPDFIQNPDGSITVTASVSLSQTKALTSGGEKTFAEGEKLAVIYTNTSGNKAVAVSDELTTDDIKRSGKYAKFHVTFTNPNKTLAVTYVYPASMAKNDGNINYDALYNNQDGTLTKISSDFDLCTQDVSWSGSSLPDGTALVNQLTVAQFKIKNSANSSDITSSLTGLTVTNGSDVYNVSLDSKSTVWVAMKPITTGDIVFSATDGSYNYAKTVTGQTMSKGTLYSDITVNMTKEKKDASVTAPTAVAATLTYSGSAQTLFSAGSTTGGTMKYKVTTTNDKPASTDGFKTTIDQGTNAGTYYLWYYVDGGDDYNTTDVNGTAVTKAIGKAAATLTCNNSAISFSSTEPKNSTKTKTGVSCTGGTINVASASTGNCTVNYFSGNITVTRKTDSAFTNTQITVSVTPDGNHTAPSNVTFNVSATAYDTGVALSASSVGYVVATDALCYPASSFPAGKTKAGVVVFKSGSSGLVVSLTNLSSTQNWNNIASRSDSPKTLSHTPAVSGKSWVCGTKTQYSNMWGGGSGCSSWSDFNTKITNAGGTALGSRGYWSCTEGSGKGWAFGSGSWYNTVKSNTYYVRPCFAF